MAINETPYRSRQMKVYPIDRVTSSPSEERISLDAGGVTRRTSLTLPSQISLSSWKRIGKQIFVLSDGSAWWLGDWLIYGQENFPDRYKVAMEESALYYQTLRNYAWIARKFSPSRRREKLSFQHHAEVAVLDEEEQELWLTRAEKFSWSRNELRRQLKQATRSIAKEVIEVSLVKVSVSAARRECWELAAQRASQDLLGWMVSALDEAAQSADESLER